MLSLTLIIDKTLLYKQFLSSRSTINLKINIDLKCVSMQCNYITEMGLVAKKDFILYFDNTHIYATRQYAFILAKGIASHCVFRSNFQAQNICAHEVLLRSILF